MQPGFRPTDSAVAGMPMNSLRVLIVDDDDEMCMFLRQELGKYFITDVASDGQDAMDKINDRRPDLVISDVMMPRVDGFGLTRWLRANTATAATPIILLTALDGEDKRYQGLQTGADAYIAKPFSMRLLVMQCRNLLMRVAAAAAAADDNRDGAARLPEVITDEADSRLLKAIGVYIDSHLADPGLSVDKIADAMNYGRSKFYDKVKHLTGKTHVEPAIPVGMLQEALRHEPHAIPGRGQQHREWRPVSHRRAEAAKHPERQHIAKQAVLQCKTARLTMQDRPSGNPERPVLHLHPLPAPPRPRQPRVTPGCTSHAQTAAPAATVTSRGCRAAHGRHPRRHPPRP